MRRYGQARRKFGREQAARRSLIKGLADSLIFNESLTTTLPKAKEVISYTERLITKAKQQDLHARRQVISGLATIETAHKLVDEIAPKLGSRTSGYFKLQKTGWRRGDMAPLAKISFVDDLGKKAPPAKLAATKSKVKVAKAASSKKPTTRSQKP